VRKADNLPPSCADVKKSGALPGTCGPVQACNGTALALPCVIRRVYVIEDYSAFLPKGRLAQ
jgi:hypothetical protein